MATSTLSRISTGTSKPDTMTKTKTTLRLLVTSYCKRACPGCCNQDWDLESLPVVRSFKKYKRICLTGGEPMLYSLMLLYIAKQIRQETDAEIIVYSAKTDSLRAWEWTLRKLDGATITLHETRDIKDFARLNEFLLSRPDLTRDKSLRLNVFKGIPLNGMDLSLWKVKDNITWKSKSLPDNEEFLRWVDLSR